jgi:hypothetical protein
VSVGRSKDVGMSLARKHEIIDVLSLADEKPIVLTASN